MRNSPELSSVTYKDCGSGGAGKVLVTFAPSGRVTRAQVTWGAYDVATTASIEARFGSARVEAFDGTAHMFAWPIRL